MTIPACLISQATTRLSLVELTDYERAVYACAAADPEGPAVERLQEVRAAIHELATALAVPLPPLR